MFLEWSVLALADRNRIFDSIEADSPRAAGAIDARIEAAFNELAAYPEMGAAWAR